MSNYIQETEWWKEGERVAEEAFIQEMRQKMDRIIIEAFTDRQGVIREDAQHEE